MGHVSPKSDSWSDQFFYLNFLLLIKINCPSQWSKHRMLPIRPMILRVKNGKCAVSNPNLKETQLYSWLGRKTSKTSKYKVLWKMKQNFISWILGKIMRKIHLNSTYYFLDLYTPALGNMAPHIGWWFNLLGQHQNFKQYCLPDGTVTESPGGHFVHPVEMRHVGNMNFMAINLLWEFFCCKMISLVKGKIVLDTMNKASYKAMNDDIGRSTEHRRTTIHFENRSPFLCVQITAYSTM